MSNKTKILRLGDAKRLTRGSDQLGSEIGSFRKEVG